MNYKISILGSIPGKQGTQTFWSFITDLEGVSTVMTHGDRKGDESMKYVVTRTHEPRDDADLQDQLDTNW